MKNNRKITQFTLISIGVVLIFATYFLYPRFNEKIVKKSIIKDEAAQIGNEKSNVFENVEYKGFYNTDTIFSVKSEKLIRVLTSFFDICSFLRPIKIIS